MIGQVRSLLAHSIDPRIEIQVRLEAESSTVVGDATQLQNALLNLGVNARDAMAQGGRLCFQTRNVALGEQDCLDAPLVLLDLVMPDMSGPETFAAIRAIRSDLPVVISSGYSSEQALQDTLNLGAAGVLSKPYRIDELSRTVAQHTPAGTSR